MPQSEAPGVIERRTRLERQLRTALLGSHDVGLMGAWTRTRWGSDDLEMWQRQAVELPESSPLRAVAATEVERLNREYGLPTSP